MASWMIDPTDWYPLATLAGDGPTDDDPPMVAYRRKWGDPMVRAQGAQAMRARCRSTYGPTPTLLGRPIRCEGRIGHTGQHGHSFAARYWDDAS